METTSTMTPAQERQHVPGEAGVWLFVLGDMVIFGILFSVYLYYRGYDVEGFNAAQAKLNPNFGVINTLLLLSSSWCVAVAINALRKGNYKVAQLLFRITLLCACGFAGVKFFEYGAKISEGYTLTSGGFFMYYYMLTGLHFLHLIIGMIVLLILLIKIGKETDATPDMMGYESGATYWHMVDLLWIFLFPLLYLVN